MGKIFIKEATISIQYTVNFFKLIWVIFFVFCDNMLQCLIWL